MRSFLAGVRGRRIVTVLLIAAIGLGECLRAADTSLPARVVAIEERMTMDIIVRLRVDIARALHSGAENAAATQGLQAVLTQFGVALKPLHPGVSDPQLQSYFMISGVTSADADHIVAALRTLDEVEAAYVQPPMSPA